MAKLTKKQIELDALIAAVLAAFAEVVDPRVPRTRRYSLELILTISLLAVIAGANGFVGIQRWAEAKEDWLRTFLDIPDTLPSHDTIGRVFAALDPQQFTAALQRWTEALRGAVGEDVVAIDGKALRRSIRAAGAGSLVHMVSAWSSQNGIVLGQVATNDKSNEITAIPALLDTLSVENSVITIDAAGCQREITRKLMEKKADYVIALKLNQPTLFESTVKLFTGYGAGHRELDFHSTQETGHGRSEERRCWVSREITELERAEKFAGLASIVRIESIRTVGGKTSTTDRYFISSIENLTATRALSLVRNHWSIENELHWTLDMAFREDESRIRAKNAAENFSRIRQHALALLKAVPNVKVGIETRRMMAGWNDRFLLQVLTGARPG